MGSILTQRIITIRIIKIITKITTSIRTIKTIKWQDYKLTRKIVTEILHWLTKIIKNRIFTKNKEELIQEKIILI
jgi:hypothetical protein